MFAATPALTCGATFVPRCALREMQIHFGNLAASTEPALSEVEGIVAPFRAGLVPAQASRATFVSRFALFVPS